MLKTSFGYTAEQVIHQNFIVSMFSFLATLVLAYLSYIIYPLKIVKTLLLIFCLFALACPYLFNNINSSFDVFLMQLCIV